MRLSLIRVYCLRLFDACIKKLKTNNTQAERMKHSKLSTSYEGNNKNDYSRDLTQLFWCAHFVGNLPRLCELDQASELDRTSLLRQTPKLNRSGFSRSPVIYVIADLQSILPIPGLERPVIFLQWPLSRIRYQLVGSKHVSTLLQELHVLMSRGNMCHCKRPPCSLTFSLLPNSHSSR